MSATQEFHLRANIQMEEELVNALRATPTRLGGWSGWPAATSANRSKSPISWRSAATRRAYVPVAGRFGFRRCLAVPLLREDHIMGALTVYRRIDRELSPRKLSISSRPSPPNQS